MKAVVTVGAPASGKSKWTKEWIAERKVLGETWVEINRDNIRFQEVQPGGNWVTWNWGFEREVTEVADSMLAMAAGCGHNVVISDTNLNEITRLNKIATLQKMGYEVEVKRFDVPYETLVKRDIGRDKPVGAFTIGQHHFRMAEQFGKRYVPDDSKPKAVIVDIDGTVAKMNGRGPFEWYRVGEDLPRDEVIAAVEGVAHAFGAQVLITSGRDASCREQTQKWLYSHGIWHRELFMRPQGDMRKDTLVKEEIFWRDIEPKYNVIAAFDDRPVIVRLWHEIGIPNVFDVANPYLEF